MPSISASPSSNALTAKKTEANTRQLEGYLELLVSEVRRLRLGDTSTDDVNVVGG